MRQVKFIKIVPVMLSLLLTTSCAGIDFGDTVYMETWDDGIRIHIDRNCKNFDKDGNVEYIEAERVHRKVLFVERKVWHIREGSMSDYPFCPKCVSDKDAKRIRELNKAWESGEGKNDTIVSNLQDYD